MGSRLHMTIIIVIPNRHSSVCSLSIDCNLRSHGSLYLWKEGGEIVWMHYDCYCWSVIVVQHWSYFLIQRRLAKWGILASCSTMARRVSSFRAPMIDVKKPRWMGLAGGRMDEWAAQPVDADWEKARQDQAARWQQHDCPPAGSENTRSVQ